MSRFVVTSAGRSGSELLVTMLNSHPDIVCRGEIFNAVDDAYKARIRSGMSHMDMLEATYAMCPWKTRGFKLLYFHAQDGGGEVWRHLESQDDIKVIHLVRDNGLARFISWKISKETGIWQYYTERDDNPTHVTLSIDECVRTWEGCEQREKEVDAGFSGHPFMKLHYSDLGSDPDAVTDTVQDFLGVERHKLRTTLRKRHRRPFELLDNFQELKWHFKDTRWAWFFTDQTEMK